MKAVGHRLIVKVIDTSTEEEVSEGGIILDIKSKSEQHLEKVNSELAEVIDVGPQAWHEKVFATGEPWAKIGDLIQVRKYSGTNIVEDKDPENLYRVINDEDVLCIVEES